MRMLKPFIKLRRLWYLPFKYRRDEAEAIRTLKVRPESEIYNQRKVFEKRLLEAQLHNNPTEGIEANLRLLSWLTYGSS